MRQSWPGSSRLVPAIHVFQFAWPKTWMPGTRLIKPGNDESVSEPFFRPNPVLIAAAPLVMALRPERDEGTLSRN